MTVTEVILWDMCGAGLIVPRSSGVRFSNQVGGGACFQRSLEGIFIPINQDSQRGDYVHTLEAKLMGIFHDIVTMGGTQADQIDSVLAESELTKGIIVDRGRISESCEAWVHVAVEETSLSAFKGFGNFGAVLTWPNSD